MLIVQEGVDQESMQNNSPLCWKRLKMSWKNLTSNIYLQKSWSLYFAGSAPPQCYFFVFHINKKLVVLAFNQLCIFCMFNCVALNCVCAMCLYTDICRTDLLEAGWTWALPSSTRQFWVTVAEGGKYALGFAVRICWNDEMHCLKLKIM